MGRNAKPDTVKKTCSGECGKNLPESNFYTSNSRMHKDGRLPICKNCLKSMVDVNDVESVKAILRQIDKPFISEVWARSIAQKNNHPFGEFLRQINSLHQYKNLTWDGSIFGEESEIQEFDFVDELDAGMEDEVEEEEFKVTRAIVEKWGASYKPREYMHLERFYSDMMATHDIKTPQHKKLLVLMCKMNLKMDKYLEMDDMQNFTKLHSEYQKLLTSSGFRPIDKVSGADAAGMQSIGQVFEFVEKKGFIKPAPLELDTDKLDMEIMYLLNYNRRLYGLGSLEKPPEDLPWHNEEEDGDYDGGEEL